MTNNEVIKEIRLAARNVGLTFKTQNATINGAQAYRFTDRATGATKLENYTLASAYEDVCSGYIESYNKATGAFDGI